MDAMDEEQIKRLGHDLRGALTTAMLVAERLQSHADPSVVRSATLIGQSVDVATTVLRRAMGQRLDIVAATLPQVAQDRHPGWDPAQYLRFGDERLRPARDLLARLDHPGAATIVDLGCGPGNVTALLAQRWPHAGITGIDASAAMLDRARANMPNATFIQTDIATWTPAKAPDIIYSNAALHWLGDHETLLPRLLSLLAPGGVLAMQMPLMHDAPFRTLIPETAAAGPWAEQLATVAPVPAILDPRSYWDLLRPSTKALDLWETIYHHALAGEDAVMQWATGTSLRPFLDALPDDTTRKAFQTAYAQALKPHYPAQPDGTTLLSFHRLFMVAGV